VSTATAAGTALVLGFGATHVLQGQLTVGELLVLLTYIAAIYKPLEAISATVGSLHEQFVYFNASLDLLETEPEVKEAPDAIALERTRGEVTFDHVGFAYQGRVDTLKDVTFRVEPGERVAIVGPTGAGKTTLVSLLIRFYDPQQGTIRLDGIDTRRLTLESLRSQVAVVLQEPLLFSGTIAENIRYGRLDATTEELEAAARAANAHEFITRLPQGYQTELGERGAQLSGGERQRLAIARAFLKDAPIIVLDEPTSSIDSRTEAVILDALEDLTVGRTSFVIAHRLSTVRHADRILVMNHGELVEQGTHEELLEQGGMYRHLHEAQNRPRVRRFAREAAAVPAGAAAAGGADPPTTNGNGTGRGADGVGREPSDRHEGDGEHAPGPPPPSAAPVADGAVGVATPARRRARRRRPLALALAALAGVGGSAAAGGLLPSGDDSAPTSRSPASTSAAPRPESSPATAPAAPERPPVERRDSGSPGVEELWEEYPLEPGGP
jgi:ABC-type multidrug transport system ATPase subunit